MTMMQKRVQELLCIVFLVFLNTTVHADTGKGSKANLAQQANNPIANMNSVPFQLNTNYDVAPENQDQNVLTIQPVIPFELNKRLNT